MMNESTKHQRTGKATWEVGLKPVNNVFTIPQDQSKLGGAIVIGAIRYKKKMEFVCKGGITSVL
jgi:hypothetical protein